MLFKLLQLPFDILELPGQVKRLNSLGCMLQDSHGGPDLIPGHPRSQGTLEGLDGSAADAQQASHSAIQGLLPRGGIGRRKLWVAQPEF
jgi:hypothetical protein